MEDLANCLREILTRLGSQFTPHQHRDSCNENNFNKLDIFMWHLVFNINPIFRVLDVDTYNSLRILGLKWIIVVCLFLFRWNSMMTTIGFSSWRDGAESELRGVKYFISRVVFLGLVWWHPVSKLKWFCHILRKIFRHQSNLISGNFIFHSLF